MGQVPLSPGDVFGYFFTLSPVFTIALWVVSVSRKIRVSRVPQGGHQCPKPGLSVSKSHVLSSYLSPPPWEVLQGT